jgi:hypothetical protein
VLQLIVQRIVVEDHRITIAHVVPSGPIRLQPEHHLNRNLRFCISRRCRLRHLRVSCYTSSMKYVPFGTTCLKGNSEI